jgi:hypothetical protein
MLLAGILRTVIDDALSLRRAQNLASGRADVRAVTPSIRSFAQALDRQRRAVERVPLVRASRGDAVAVCAALDEAEVAALALWVHDPAAELPAFAAVAAASSVPVLRADLILEEAQVYQSRAAGADAVLLHAALLPDPLLQRLCEAARSTHMAAAVVCASRAELERATAARAPILALAAKADGLVPDELLSAVPPRVIALAVPAGPLWTGPTALDPAALRGRADALLDLPMGAAADPAAAFRAHLDSEGAL